MSNFIYLWNWFLILQIHSASRKTAIFYNTEIRYVSGRGQSGEFCSSNGRLTDRLMLRNAELMGPLRLISMKSQRSRNDTTMWLCDGQLERMMQRCNDGRATSFTLTPDISEKLSASGYAMLLGRRILGLNNFYIAVLIWYIFQD